MHDSGDESLSHTSPPRRDPRRDRWAPVDGDPAAVLAYPSDRNGAVRMVETTFSYTQSTFSPRVIHIQSTFSHFQSTFSHMWIHIQSTWGSTYVDPRTWFPMPGDIGESMAFNAGWWKPCRTM
jgi:hypothetical protein